MAGMGRHSKLTKGQRWLACAIAGLALADAPVFFVVMFITVNDLLGPFFDGWAWTVPVATELSFTILFLLGVLLAWADRAPGWLWFAPFPFAAASLWLNVYGAHGSMPGMVGHGVVTVAFFVPLLALKAAVHRFTVSEEERRLTVAVADAIAHARDILRAALGPFWRLRVPVLLRRQLRSRRLPAGVLEEIRQGVMFGGATRWEPAVEAWITSSLALPEGVQAQLRSARDAASRATPGPAPGPAPGTAPETVRETTPEARPQARPEHAPERASKPALKLTAARSRSMPPDKLAAHVAAMIEEYGDVSLNRVKDDLHVGTDKAKAALEIAARQARGADVVLMERRAKA